jgi:hypothetical protein
MKRCAIIKKSAHEAVKVPYMAGCNIGEQFYIDNTKRGAALSGYDLKARFAGISVRWLSTELIECADKYSDKEDEIVIFFHEGEILIKNTDF